MVSLTNHQWEAVRHAADWYKQADKMRHEFDAALMESLEDFTKGSKLNTMLGRGQDFFFGGVAGSGKTTVVGSTLDEMGLSPDEVAFCAPTGKAALILGQKLRAMGINSTPTTIHKLIYTPKADRADRIQRNITFLKNQIIAVKSGQTTGIYYDDRGIDLAEAELQLKQLNLDLIRAMDNDDGPKFHLRPRAEFPEQVKLIIVDEGSMVGESLANDLATFGCPILAFGDPGQLPPVGDDYGFDCHTPDAFLTEIHRQAADNPIIRLATMAREGKDIPVGDYGDGVQVVRRKDDKATLDMDREAMVLCGTHVKRWNLTKKIRHALGYTETGPCEGEPLLFIKNSQKLEGMVNGTLVTCMTEHGDLRKGAAQFGIKISDDEGGGAQYDVQVAQGIFEEHLERRRNAYSAPSTQAFAAKKNCEQLDWGHVLTVHKSQGSQWDEVVLHDESGVFREDAHRWLYTGITRAAKRLTVVV